MAEPGFGRSDQLPLPQKPAMAEVAMDPYAPPMDIRGLIAMEGAIDAAGRRAAQQAAANYLTDMTIHRAQTGDTTIYNVQPQNNPNTGADTIIRAGQNRDASRDYISQRRSDAMRGTETQDPYRIYAPSYR